MLVVGIANVVRVFAALVDRIMSPSRSVFLDVRPQSKGRFVWPFFCLDCMKVGIYGRSR